MNWKKYAILVPTFLLIGALLLFYLPLSQLQYVMLVPLLFWILYHLWTYKEKGR